MNVGRVGLEDDDDDDDENEEDVVYLGAEQNDDEPDEQSSSSSSSSEQDEEEEEEDEQQSKRRKRESDIMKKVRTFWKKRGLVRYAREWQTYSASYIKECVRQVQNLKPTAFSTVHTDTFTRISSATHSIGDNKDEYFSKYLHLKSGDNDITTAIVEHLECKDAAVVFVSTLTFSLIYLHKNFFS